MKKKANASATYAITMASIIGMISFVIGGMANNQATKENFLFIMGFCALIILFSLTTLLTKNK